MVGQHGKVRIGPQTSLRLRRLYVRPERGQGQTNLGALTDLKCRNPEISRWTLLPGLAADVPDRVTDCHREASPPRSTQYEVDTVALLKQFKDTRNTVKCEGRGQCTHLGEHTARGTWSLPESM